MKITYCTEWSLFRKQPYHILSESDAKEKHINGEPYVVVIYETEDVINVIEIDESSLTVRFYNEKFENYLLYGFVKKDNRLFLNTAYHYLYNNGEEVEQTLFNFKDTGELFMERSNNASKEVEQREIVVDVTCNWEDFQEFGDYFGIIRAEREK